MTHPTTDVVPVALPNHPYEIHVGMRLLDRLGDHLRAVGRARRVGLVTDGHVAPLYLDRAAAALRAASLDPVPIVISPGEASKSFAMLENVLRQLLRADIERSDMLVALGGGVVGDLTGLAASLLRRGVGFVQVPTTLLAQVDSSVGGKTGIDTPEGKNLVGSFHQPARVLVDIETLRSLPPRDLRAGYAEVVKYGLINDASFFAWCETQGPNLIEGDEAARRAAIVAAVRAKAQIVMADEREQGERALLNLGHTFGHALETASGFGERLLHGEAIAIGMCLAFALSAELGFAPPTDTVRLVRHLMSVGLPTTLADIEGPRISADGLMAHMMQDKKKSEGKLALILVRGIGRAFFTRDVEPAAIRQFLARQLQGAA